MCVVGKQQEIEPRQHVHVQCTDQAHIVGLRTRYTKKTAAAKAVARTYQWNVLDLRRPRDIKPIPYQREPCRLRKHQYTEAMKKDCSLIIGPRT